MKKYLFILLMFLSFSCFSNDLFYASAKFSYLPQIKGIDRKYDDWEIDNDSIFFSTSALVGITYKGIFAEAETIADMYKSESFMFQPYTQEYYTRVGFKKGLIKIQWEHLCLHSIDGRGVNGGHDEISITFDTRGFK